MRTHLSEVPDESPVGSPTLAPDHSAANADVDPLSVDDLTPPTPRGTMSRLKRRRMTKLFPEDLTIAQSPSVFLPILTLIFRVSGLLTILFIYFFFFVVVVHSFGFFFCPKKPHFVCLDFFFLFVVIVARCLSGESHLRDLVLTNLVVALHCHCYAQFSFLDHDCLHCNLCFQVRND